MAGIWSAARVVNGWPTINQLIFFYLSIIIYSWDQLKCTQCLRRYEHYSQARDLIHLCKGENIMNLNQYLLAN